MVMRRLILVLILISFVLGGCAGVTIHDDLKLPPGRIEGNQFTGIRYPFKVSIPPHWKMVTEFPSFLKELGYDEPGASDNEVTELYIFNPSTQSTIQIDFTPANRNDKFSQERIERLTTAVTGNFKEELQKDYGKDVQAEIGPTEPIVLKGVRFAAKKYATYTVKEVKKEQGWIYAFSEPYQIFILYLILDKSGGKDREDIQKILSSFEVISKK